MFIEPFDAEANLLRRRIEFLELMDALLKSAAINHTEIAQEDGDIQAIFSEYRTVRYPADVIAGLKQIYSRVNLRKDCSDESEVEPLN